MRALRNWFRRRDLESGLDRELHYHFDRLVADLMESGLTEQAARKEASLELGGLTQVREQVRDVWFTRWIRDFVYDLRFSARSFLRSPTFTATAVLSLALGIGATTAIYSLVDQVLLHALPVREPDRLALIDWKGEQFAPGFGSYNLMSYPLCRDLQARDKVFDGVFCRAMSTVNFSTGGDARPAAAELVSGSYFPVLGVGAALGRVIGEDDDRTPGAHSVIVLSYDYWKTQLGGGADIVGRKAFVNQHPVTIIGVAASEFRGVDVGEVPAFWMPATMASDAIPGWTEVLNRRTRWMQIFGRLRHGVTPEQAQAGLQPWFKGMLEEDIRLASFPRVTPAQRNQFLASTLEITSSPQGHSGLRRTLSQPLWVLLAATAVLLGLACLNVAGLFLARGSARDREISTRLALGASRGRIGRQLLADSMLIALAGGVLGVCLAPIAVRALIAFLPRDGAGNGLRADIDLRLLLFAFLISVAAGILSGLAPALQSGRSSLITTLRERGGTGLGGVRIRKLIVTAQIAFTLVLVIGAALFIRTLGELMQKGPGFSTTSLISFGVDPRRNGYSPTDASLLIRRLYEEIRTAPITESSAVARVQLLTGGSWNNPMTIQATERITTERDVHLNSISPGFFGTLQIKMVAGRDFDDRDSLPVGQTGIRSVIVNEAFAKRYFGGRSPLGTLVCEGDGPDAKPNIEIVGVVADFSYRGLRQELEQAYFPIFQGGDSRGTFYVRVRGTPQNALESTRTILRKIDPELPISYFRTVDEQVSRSLDTERMLATLLASFGALALLLSLVGLYGVMSFVVTQRTREIGIRLALGASEGSAIWLVLRDALLMIAAGTAIALPCVAALGRLVQSQLYGVKTTDPLSMGLATLILTTAAVCAAWIPAYRASNVNPTDALRFE